MTEAPPIVVREYKGPGRQRASSRFEMDAAVMARHGYRVLAQDWQSGMRAGPMLALGIAGAAIADDVRLTVTYQAEPGATQPEAQVGGPAPKTTAQRRVAYAIIIVLVVVGLLLLYGTYH